MRYYQFKPILLEYRRDITADNIGDKLKIVASNDLTFSNIPMDDDVSDIVTVILNGLEQADPTSNKKYTQWLARTYANGGYRFADIRSIVADALVKFEKLKNQRVVTGAESDIGQYSNFDDFLVFINQYDLEEKQDNKGLAKVLVDNSLVRIIVPEDEAAAKYYGRGTKWCTSANNDNMFTQYNDYGKLYIIIPKNAVRNGEKYQYYPHIPDYIMDEADTLLSLKEKTSLNKRLRLFEVFGKIKEAEGQVMATLPEKTMENLSSFVINTKKNGFEVEDGFYFITPNSTSDNYIDMIKYLYTDFSIDEDADFEYEYWFLININDLDNIAFVKLWSTSIKGNKILKTNKRRFAIQKHNLERLITGNVSSKLVNKLENLSIESLAPLLNPEKMGLNKDELKMMMDGSPLLKRHYSDPASLLQIVEPDVMEDIHDIINKLFSSYIKKDNL